MKSKESQNILRIPHNNSNAIRNTKKRYIALHSLNGFLLVRFILVFIYSMFDSEIGLSFLTLLKTSDSFSSTIVSATGFSSTVSDTFSSAILSFTIG
jgi:hypothetical protein|nr:hypothetical protein [bacterium]